ncbi:MAG: WXG100 family type VII secretion target [Lapillicoccus sp.]
MAVFAKGADPDVLDAVAGRLQGYSASLEDVRQTASASISVLKGSWSGGDLEALMGRWPGADQQLLHCRQSLDGMREVLERNAKAQRLASGGGAGTLSPGGGPGTRNGKDKPDVPALQKDLKLLYKLIKSPSLLGTPLKIVNAIQHLGDWDKDLSLLKNLKGLWQADGPLGDLAAALKPGEWGSLGKVLPFLEDGGKFAKSLGTLGKALGPIGVAFGVFTMVEDFANGNTGRGIYDGAMTTLAAVALLTPPPIDVIAGALAGVMGIGELIHDHWGAVTGFLGDAGHVIGDVASTVGHGFVNAAESVGHALSSGWHSLFG